MDAKDLRIETALGERNDGSQYSQSGVAIHSIRNKPYQDIGSNPLAKAEATVRPCAVIGPDRVAPPPSSNEAYLKKNSLDIWTRTENIYPRPPEYPHKSFNNVNPLRNISPRQTFQENMPRIMVSPTYSSIKHANEANLSSAQDTNALNPKNTKQTMAPEAKYCDVPYTVNFLPNEPKNVRETEMCVPSVNSPLTRTAPHAWPPSSVNLHASRMYGAHDMYQYPQYPNGTGPRPPAVPMTRPHRTFPEEAGYVYPESYYQDASVRFKPYPSVKERYPPARYDYVSNYPSPFHPPPYLSHKYDIPNTRPHPYPMYPHLKYLENRVPEPNIEGYQRPNQNYNMPIRNHFMHPSYQPGIGNTQSKAPSYPDASIKTSGKLPFDPSKAYVEYENAKLKYTLPDFFVNDMSRSHQVHKPGTIPNYGPAGMHPIQMQQYQRKENTVTKTYEYVPHYRHFEHPIGFNPSNQTSQFSPSTIAISPTDSNASNDHHMQVTSQEDCGYVSQSSSASVRSIDSVNNRLQNEYYRRHDSRYQPIIGNPHNLPKHDTNPTNTKDSSKINVRQFLSMWNEGDEDNSTNGNSKNVTVPKLSDPNNLLKRQENTKSQDQLYVLGLVNVPSEELAKYEHIQKVSKLPENIKGYNNIELLNQFEEVIEFSNMNNFKSSSTKEFMSTKDRKNAIKRIVEVLPRPISPLDVEAKISQSVIHKEVGCNFEIKPCSPKMLNVEIASPVQNVLGERVIEKVSNPLSYKEKSPLSMRIDENISSHKIQRHESTLTTYENSSCKMVGSPFSTNNMEPVKTNYSLQDLETNSGVCLASLPRLDNEIELNFPEVNQQFINANKKDCNLLEKYYSDKTEGIVKTASSNKTTDNHIQICTNEPADYLLLTNQIENRKTANNNFDNQSNESNANASRKDSVIIENPENVKKYEEKHYLYKTGDEVDTPINLTQNNSHAVSKPDTTNSSNHKSHQTESAIDFSHTKSKNELPIINAYDDITPDMLTESSFDSPFENDYTVKNNDDDSFIQSPEFVSHKISTKSIIVENKSNFLSDCKIKNEDDKQHNDSINEKPAVNLKEDVATKEMGHSIEESNSKMDTDSPENNIVANSMPKEKFTKVIVKEKSDLRISLIQKTIEDEEKVKSMSSKNGSQIKPSESSSLDTNTKEISQKSTTGREITVGNITEDNLTVNSGTEIEVSQTNSSTSPISIECNDIMLSENNAAKQCINAQSSTDISTYDTNHKHTETVFIDDSEKTVNRISTETAGIKDAVSEINTEITHKSSKYYSDLMSVTELLDKPNDSDALRIESPVNNNENAFVDNGLSPPQPHTSDDTLKTSDNMESIKIYEAERDFTILHNDNTGMDSNNVDELNTTISDFTKELVAHQNENSELVINSSADKTKIIPNSIEVDDYGKMSENKRLFEKHGSSDSGYESNKNSIAENDQNSITDISGNNINQDSVSKDEEKISNLKFESEVTEKRCEEKVHQAGSENESNSKDLPEIPSCGPTYSTDSCTVATSIIEFKASDAKHCMQQTKKSNVDIYDKVDANMQILFEQPNDKTIPEIVRIENGELGNNDRCIQTENEINHIENSNITKTSPEKEIANAEGDEQLLNDCEVDITKEITNIKESKSEHELDFTMKIDEDDIKTLNDSKTETKETNQIIPFDKVNTTHISANELFGNNTIKICTDKEEEELHNSFSKKTDNTPWNIKKYCPFYQKLTMNDAGKVTFQQNQTIKCVVEVPTNIGDLHVGNMNDSDINSNNLDFEFSREKLCDESSNSMDILPFPNDTNDIIAEVRCPINKKFDSNFVTDCIAQCDDQNDLIDTQDISFSYTNNSIITQITENILNRNESVLQLNCDDNTSKKNEMNCSDHDINNFSVKRHRTLKRALSDSALNMHVHHNVHDTENSRSTWPPKRNKINECENLISSNRRNSVNFEENVSFCILIDEDCIITEESEDKICIAELQGNFITTEAATDSNYDCTSPIQELYTNTDETNTDFVNSETLECEKENSSQAPWIEDIGCVETVFSDEVAENVVISASTSPKDITPDNYHDSSFFYDIASTSYTDKVKLLHGEKLSYEDAQVVDALYKTPHMDIMNKTLLYGDKHISDSDNNLSDDDSVNINLESDEWKASPTHTPDYIDPTHVSSEFRLETPENKENVFVKELSPLRKIDDYLDVSSAENDNDEHILPKPVNYFTKRTQDSTIHSCESSLDDVFDYKLKDDSIGTKMLTSSTTSSSPEVSSTTSEEKNSSLVLKITNLNGARVSQINEVEKINRPRCKFTENNEYSASNVHFPNRPLMTKAAQKYIPPIKESIRDLKVRITLPQQSLLKLKQLKVSQSESKPKVRQQHAVIPRIAKKPKLNFDDVLKSIDEIQFKKHKEKSKKPKTVVPKVVIKKSENGSHYASTPKKNSFNPDLTGRKWQPWVFLEKNIFIDKMASRNKTKAIFSHRKNAYILAEKFKKYKSVSSTKFIISQPKTPGDLKYTIRLKHTY